MHVDLTTIVYSPPLKDNGRGLGFGYADGQFSEEKGLFATGLRVLSGGHVISGSRQSTLNAFSIMSINPACAAGMILMITGVLVRQLERLSHRVPLRAMKNGVTGNSAQAYVRWYQNERRKYGVSGFH